MELFTFVLITIASILAIGKGSDWLTDSLIPLARKLGVSRSSLGLLLVSAAVSLPEILVAVFATLKGYPAISLGVILGSIICNIGLMTGFSATIKSLSVSTPIILRDGVFSIIVPILVLAVGADGQITRFEGLALFLLFIPYVINVMLHERLSSPEQKEKHIEEMMIELNLIGFDFGKLKPGWFTFALGLGLLLGGTQLFGSQLIGIAEHFGINQLLIGLTLGAFGPSIPNIMAAYNATTKGMGEIAVSETFGSNIFTLLVTLGISAMLAPIVISEAWLQFDIPVLIVMSFVLFIFSVSHKRVTRGEGVILMTTYIGIVIVQIMKNYGW